MIRLPHPRRAQRGFSIVELLVSVAIGLVITLAVFGMLAASEGRKRTSVGLNDANQSGTYAAYTIDRVIRSAGTGYAQGWARVGGCRLNAVLPTAETWPRAAALPEPFAALPQTLRLAPVVVFQDASATGSDVLMVMNGTAGFGESPVAVQPAGVTATEVLLPNTIGYRANDLVMLSGGGECLLTQVASTKPACAGDPAAAPANTPCGQQLPLGGDYYAATAGSTSLAALAGVADVNAFNIGNATTNRPQFMLYGVGDNSTLFSYDLLLPVNDEYVSVPVAEGVRRLHAVYGLDTNDDGILDTWQSPGAAGWTGDELMNGSAVSVGRLRQIVALRVGFVMRSSLIERDVVAPETLSLFTDLPAGLDVEVDLTAADENRNQRHRTIEITVPVRNLLMRTT